MGWLGKLGEELGLGARRDVGVGAYGNGGSWGTALVWTLAEGLCFEVDEKVAWGANIYRVGSLFLRRNSPVLVLKNGWVNE